MANFQENNYMFYEWLENDSIDLVRKIPVFHITNKVLIDIINNDIQVTSIFLENIYNKTKLKKGMLEYSALFVNKNGAIILEFSKDGKSISRSFLQVGDECKILEVIYTIPLTKLEYKLIKKINNQKQLRFEKIVKDFISLEINTLYNKKDIEKLVFLYNEWFRKSKQNVVEMIKDMQSKLKCDITDSEIKIYKLIKLSYSNV